MLNVDTQVFIAVQLARERCSLDGGDTLCKFASLDYLLDRSLQGISSRASHHTSSHATNVTVSVLVETFVANISRMSSNCETRLNSQVEP